MTLTDGTVAPDSGTTSTDVTSTVVDVDSGGCTPDRIVVAIPGVETLTNVDPPKVRVAAPPPRPTRDPPACTPEPTKPPDPATREPTPNRPVDGDPASAGSPR